MSLRIPLTKDQTLQVEFHEIERRLRKLERTLGQTAGSTTIQISGGGGGTVTNIQPILDRLSALETIVLEIGSTTLTEFKGVGDGAISGIVPSPGLDLPPAGLAEHVLKEDATWGFPFRGLLNVTTQGDGTDSATDNINMEGSLTVNADLIAHDIEARQVRTIDGVTLQGDSYQVWSDERGLVFVVTEEGQTDQPDDVVNILGDLHIGDLSAADVECFNLHTHGDIEYGDSFWDDLRIEPVARTTGANSPTFEQWADDAGLGDTGTSRGVYLYSFDDAAGGSEKEVYFTMQMPHSWKAGTAISLHVHWIGAVADTTAAPRWGLEYTWKSIGQTFGANEAIIYSTPAVNFNGSTYETDVVAGKHYISEFASISPGATASAISSILIARLFRDSANAGDTYNAAGAKCGLLYVDAHIELISPGSSSEYVQ